jgi:hypothetical protein
MKKWKIRIIPDADPSVCPYRIVQIQTGQFVFSTTCSTNNADKALAIARKMAEALS